MKINKFERKNSINQTDLFFHKRILSKYHKGEYNMYNSPRMIFCKIKGQLFSLNVNMCLLQNVHVHIKNMLSNIKVNLANIENRTFGLYKILQNSINKMNVAAYPQISLYLSLMNEMLKFGSKGSVNYNRLNLRNSVITNYFAKNRGMSLPDKIMNHSSFASMRNYLKFIDNRWIYPKKSLSEKRFISKEEYNVAKRNLSGILPQSNSSDIKTLSYTTVKNNYFDINFNTNKNSLISKTNRDQNIYLQTFYKLKSIIFPLIKHDFFVSDKDNFDSLKAFGTTVLTSNNKMPINTQANQDIFCRVSKSSEAANSSIIRHYPNKIGFDSYSSFDHHNSNDHLAVNKNNIFQIAKKDWISNDYSSLRTRRIPLTKHNSFKVYTGSGATGELKKDTPNTSQSRMTFEDHENIYYKNKHTVEHKFEKMRKSIDDTKKDLEDKINLTHSSVVQDIKDHLNINYISENVYQNIERKLRIEKERRGI